MEEPSTKARIDVSPLKAKESAKSEIPKANVVYTSCKFRGKDKVDHKEDCIEYH